ncbi:MAG: glycerol-3-phosphate responsive antiterminator [Ruminococcaceae bacterium]|nr:glycerol-3-phosphate responsive antiterminator [Oscillospiraceae bacterium]
MREVRIFLLFLLVGVKMKEKILNCLEQNPVIATVKGGNFKSALNSPAKVLFMMSSNILTLKDRIKEAHENGKFVFVHVDLADGLGKDKYGLKFLQDAGVDGILSTKTPLIKNAKEMGILAVQRFFVYDSQGACNVDEVITSTHPDIIEIMPGVIDKITKRFSAYNIPLIAGGFVETKNEVTSALKNGAFAVSTTKEELWYI